MSSTRIIQYIHRPNKTELGQGNTHETYMLIDSKTDVSDICPPGVEVLVTDPLKKRTYRLKSAKGNEFRVNQMGPIYRDYDIKPGDEIILTQYKKGEDVKNILSVNTYNRVCFEVTLLDEYAKKFKKAVDIAHIDTDRATTHNKGIYNGIDAVVIATGNDSRPKAGMFSYTDISREKYLRSNKCLVMNLRRFSLKSITF